MREKSWWWWDTMYAAAAAATNADALPENRSALSPMAAPEMMPTYIVVLVVVEAGGHQNSAHQSTEWMWNEIFCAKSIEPSSAFAAGQSVAMEVKHTLTYTCIHAMRFTWSLIHIFLDGFSPAFPCLLLSLFQSSRPWVVDIEWLRVGVKDFILLFAIHIYAATDAVAE